MPRVSKLLQVVGALALVALVVGSLAALVLVGQRVHVTIQDGDGADRGPETVELLGADLSALHDDVRALADGTRDGLSGLYDSLEEGAVERESRLRAEVSELRRELASARTSIESLERRSSENRAALDALLARGPDAGVGAAIPPPEPSSRPEPVPASEPVALSPTTGASSTEAPADAPRKKTFLAFELPSSTFSFEGRQRLALVPSLSRVGFDAKSTLHDFTGVTQKVSGELVVDLARPDAGASGRIAVDARSLDTGVAGRDEEMRSRLDVEHHGELAFTWTGFEPTAVDSDAQTVAGRALGSLSIRGVQREVLVPVKVAVDASRRVSIEGEASIRLSDFGVEAPSQLGVISVEDRVTIWFALRARSLGAAPLETPEDGE
jgi:polyisoprenoid-binding protein YceI